MALRWAGIFGRRAAAPSVAPAVPAGGNPAADAAAVAALVDTALTLHKAGDLVAARGQYDAILVRVPEHAETLRLRGMLGIQTGDFEGALRFLRASAKADPRDARTHANLGVALQQLGRHTEALESYAASIALEPAHPVGYFNQGVVLEALGRHDEALGSYDAAIARDPAYAAAHQNRAVVLYHLRRFGDALAAVDRAIDAQANFAEAHCHRGAVLQALHRREEAIASFDRAIALRPDLADAHANRGAVLQELNRPAEALAGIDQAIALRPAFAEALANRANALLDLGRADEALASCDRAIALRPDFAKAHFNRGNVLLDLHRAAEAAASYAQARTLDPDDSDALLALLRQKAEQCDWADRAADDALIPALGIRGPPVSPLALLAVEDDPARHRTRAERFTAQQYGTAVAAPPVARAKERIHIGYFSADFREHVIARLIAGVLERHDRERFKVHAYAYGPPSDDAMRQRIAAAVEVFRDVTAMGDQDVVGLARRDGIDIAIDLTGYTKHARTAIFNQRAAPIQVSYLGYPGTMGAPFIDYLIADAILIPEEQRAHYSERIVYLPDNYLANDYAAASPGRRLTRSAMGLPEQGFVFCCFNNSYKITPSVFDIWMRLLHATEGSVLWLAQPNPSVAGNLRREAMARGIDARRLIFAERMAFADYIESYRLADLFLDTFPYNANATACDALWAGLPMVTRPGAGLITRAGASLLNAMGLPELIATSPETYATLALELATNEDKLSAVQARLATHRLSHPLFDTMRITRRIEAGYIAMRNRHWSGAAADHIFVGP